MPLGCQLLLGSSHRPVDFQRKEPFHPLPLGQAAVLSRRRCVQVALTGKLKIYPTISFRPWAPRVSSLKFEIQTAIDSAELRSVAFLRAAVFASPNANCSALAAQYHLKMKAASMWEYLEEVTGQGMSQQGLTTCFYASMRDDLEDAAALAVRQEMDLSCILPANEEAAPRIVIGSLDLTVAKRLGGETLAGRHPSANAAAGGRAYICNVVVAPAGRRQGIASAMIEAACLHAGQAGVSDLYVHVAVDNESAVKLYKHRCGFDFEQAEGADVARSLNRPKRELLRRQLTKQH